MESTTLRLARAACRQLEETDVAGHMEDVEEIEALSSYMELCYVCPSLTHVPLPAN